jgi:hypothetical protein
MHEKRTTNASSITGAISNLVSGLIRRRNFVRNSATLLAVCVLAGAACDDSPTGQAQTGTIRVTVTGHSAAAANAGQVLHEGPLGNVVFTIPTAGTASQLVPAGTYHIVFTPPTGYMMVPGQTTERDVTVTTGGVTEESFQVVAIPTGSAGTLRITVTGHGTNGGSAQVLRTDLQGQTAVDVNIPQAGSLDLPVAAGTYRITYAAPTGYQLSAGQTNPQNATVTANQTTTVGFAVNATTGGGTNGTLRITVTGHGTNGGTAQVLRTDLQGQTATDVNIPQAGTVDLPVAAGTYRITYAAPAGYQLSPGQTNPQNATVTASQTTTVGFAVTITSGGGTGDVLFFSDFRTALGNSSAAVTDGGKWNVQATTPETMRIISSAGLAFPTANVMEMIATPERQGFAIIRKTGMPTPGIGESRYYRWYIRVMQPDNLSDYNSHPIQDGNASSQTNWMFLIIGQGGPGNVPAGHYQPEFWAESSPYPHQRWFGPDLPKNQTFRFEMQIYRANATQFQMHIRVYDSAGTLVADDDDFQAYDVGTRLSTNPLFPFTAVQNMDGLNAGNNGIANMPANSFTHSYQGGFAVCSNTWCGPYNGNY